VVKTVILAPDNKITDEQLMQDNQTIANPTNKKPVIQTRSKTRASETVLKAEEPLIKWATVPAETQDLKPEKISEVKKEQPDENQDVMTVM